MFQSTVNHKIFQTFKSKKWHINHWGLKVIKYKNVPIIVIITVLINTVVRSVSKTLNS